MYRYASQDRFFGGPFLPFIGGLLVGNLFSPSKGSYYPSYQQPTPIYFQPTQYYPVVTNNPYPQYYQNYPDYQGYPQYTSPSVAPVNANYQNYQTNQYYPE